MDIRFKWLGRKTVHAIADSFSAGSLAVYILIYVAGMQNTLADVCRISFLR